MASTYFLTHTKGNKRRELADANLQLKRILPNNYDFSRQYIHDLVENDILTQYLTLIYKLSI